VEYYRQRTKEKEVLAEKEIHAMFEEAVAIEHEFVDDVIL